MSRSNASSIDAPRVRLPPFLELLKPYTWFPPMWAFACGAVSSGVPFGDDWLITLAGVVLAGPLVCATSQAVNDWFDRHVDAINEPNRPIPSGRIPGRWGLYIAIGWTVLSLCVGFALGTWVAVATVFGLALAWAYSAPPFRLKRNGWWGNSAVAMCYEGLPWLTAVVVKTGGLPNGRILAIAALYSFGAHGIMTLNDFKSVEGDLRTGIGSLPARLGIERAARVACAFMLAAQFAIVALLVLWDRPLYALAIGALVLVQIVMMRRLLAAPHVQDYWYNTTGVPVFVLGMMVAAFALR
jgi:chlorophyll/bacteriochlorophyll a synthase